MWKSWNIAARTAGPNRRARAHRRARAAADGARRRASPVDFHTGLGHLVTKCVVGQRADERLLRITAQKSTAFGRSRDGASSRAAKSPPRRRRSTRILDDGDHLPRRAPSRYIYARWRRKARIGALARRGATRRSVACRHPVTSAARSYFAHRTASASRSSRVGKTPRFERIRPAMAFARVRCDLDGARGRAITDARRRGEAAARNDAHAFPWQEHARTPPSGNNSRATGFPKLARF